MNKEIKELKFCGDYLGIYYKVGYTIDGHTQTDEGKKITKIVEYPREHLEADWYFEIFVGDKVEARVYGNKNVHIIFN